MDQLAMTMAITFALVTTRMAAFVAVSPFPGSNTPTNVRVGLALALALAAAPMAMPGPVIPLGLPVVVAAFGELLVGVAIGFVFRVGLSAAEVLGSSLAHATGLTFAASYDPAQASNSDALTRIFTVAAMLVAIAVGAHRAVIGAVILSTRAIPIGGMLDLGAFAPGMIGWIAKSCEVGLGLALPAMTVAIIVQVALGLVARAAPSLQIFSVGFSITLAAGLTVILAGLKDSLSGLATHFGSFTTVLENVLAHAR